MNIPSETRATARVPTIQKAPRIRTPGMFAPIRTAGRAKPSEGQQLLEGPQHPVPALERILWKEPKGPADT